MNSIFTLNALLTINLVLLGGVFTYLLLKMRRHPSVTFLICSLVPLLAFELGSYLFTNWPNSRDGAKLIVIGMILTPITIVPLSQTLGRSSHERWQVIWIAYYRVQVLLLALAFHAIFDGQLIEWVTGILDQPIVLIDQNWRYYFLDVIASSVLALMCFDKTLQQANKPQKDELKFFLIAFLGFIVFFSYLSVTILLSSYISYSIIQSGAAVIFFGLIFLIYGCAKYPFWDVKIRVSRHLVFGGLSAITALSYLLISGSVLDMLRWLQPHGFNIVLPAAAFALVGLFLAFYLSPDLHSSL